jgi:hypothetical protein
MRYDQGVTVVLVVHDEETSTLGILSDQGQKPFAAEVVARSCYRHGLGTWRMGAHLRPGPCLRSEWWSRYSLNPTTPADDRKSRLLIQVKDIQKTEPYMNGDGRETRMPKITGASVALIDNKKHWAIALLGELGDRPILALYRMASGEKLDPEHYKGDCDLRQDWGCLIFPAFGG